MRATTTRPPDDHGAVGAVFAAIGRFAVRFRWLVVIVWLAGTVAAAHFLPSLASVTNSDNADFLPASAPSAHAQTLSGAFQKSGVQPITVIVATNAPQLTPADRSAIDGLTSSLGRVSGVQQVKDTGPSKNQQAEQLQVLIKIDPGANGAKPVVDDLRSAITNAHLPAGLQAHLAGQVAAQVDNQAANGNTGDKLQYMSVGLILVLLLLIFRSILAPIVTLAPAFLVVSLAGPLVGAAGEAGLKVSPLAQFLLIVLILGAGTDYGLFLMFRVREEMGRGLAHRDAVVRAVARVGESVTFSAGTVMAALVSLLAASFGLYADLGVPLAIGIGVMLVAALTLLPALLAILGKAVFWPTKIRDGSGRDGVWGKISARIVQRPVLTLVAGVILFGGLAIASFGYQSSGFGGTVTAPAGSDSAAGADLQNKYFPALAASPTSVLFRLPDAAWGNPSVLAEAEQQLTASGQFTKVTGALEPNGVPLPASVYTQLHNELGPAQQLPPVPPASVHVPPAEYQLYRATATYVSADGHTVQFLAGLKAGDPSTTEAMNAVPAIRDAVTSVAHRIGAVDSAVAGEAPAIYDISDISSSDLGTVIPIAIAVIGLLLGLVMRSVVAPLYLIASVGLSYLAALGLSVLLFIKLAGDGGLTFFMPFLMFIFLLALGEDYNILVMSRIREEAHGLPLRKAITRALSTTGTTVTSAGLILAGTFAVFAVAGGSLGTQIRDIGVGLAVGILMDTFLVRTLLVPSTAVLLGRWNWWPSKLGRKGSAPGEPPDADTPARPVPVGSGSS
ncbi:MAG TPA: MMPL family transporter [Pseudonocardiaceae bacterium]|jgi:RND superfamily putative drug exporter|nr:MMPL family transporter [Pseudonocardiaceae bacterium]